jgi:hypothetical protein
VVEDETHVLGSLNYFYSVNLEYCISLAIKTSIGYVRIREVDETLPTLENYVVGQQFRTWGL